MDTPNRWSLAKSLVRGLRYQELPELVGRRVTVHAPDSIATDVQRDLGDRLPSGWTLDGPAASLASQTLSHYRLVDVVLAVPLTALDEARSGADVLRELGFDKRLDRDDEREDDDLDSFAAEVEKETLEALTRDIAERHAFVRIMLRDRDRTRRHGGVDLAAALRGEVGSDFLPRPFEVDDACLTNARAVWAVRHCYW
jgi:hypothetical protein